MEAPPFLCQVVVHLIHFNLPGHKFSEHVSQFPSPGKAQLLRMETKVPPVPSLESHYRFSLAVVSDDGFDFAHDGPDSIVLSDSVVILSVLITSCCVVKVGTKLHQRRDNCSVLVHGLVPFLSVLVDEFLDLMNACLGI